MESLGIKDRYWEGKRVFITGHTGFKGGWLALWLSHLGAEVHGYALPAPSEDGFFAITRFGGSIAANTLADIRDGDALELAIRRAYPDIVFHLAAQPQVLPSYRNPLETYSTNILGTINLFEAIRKSGKITTIINITTDKCYQNREWVWPYRESDPLGGHDPYSNSKACVELISSAYRCSFFNDAGIAMATVRAGNVVGGGDCSSERLIPDFLRAYDSGVPLSVRSPHAIRPWQHVLEPLSGYLVLAEKLSVQGLEFAEAWNFGPAPSEERSVQWIVEYLCNLLPGAQWTDESGKATKHEAGILTLDSSKSRKLLGWQPRWNIQQTLEKTIAWHTAWRNGCDMHDCSLQQIRAYVEEPQPAP